jgi:N-methylhydantoinase A
MRLLGGDLPLNAEKARAALAEKIAAPLGRTLLDTAYGIFEVACGTMVRAVKAVSTYRGRDPRDFALFAFGGNGPVVGAALADLLEMREVIIPPDPGVFSAVGLLLSDVEQERSRAFLRRLAVVAPATLDAAYAGLEQEVRADFAADGYRADDVALTRFADLRYSGQAHELLIPYAATPAGAPDFAAMAEAFGAEHARTYGHRAEAEAVECVALRVKGKVTAPRAPMDRAAALRNGNRAPADATRMAYFGPTAGQVQVDVVSRQGLAEGERPGPLIVEEYDATCVVPPGWRARLDAAANIHLVRG